METVHVIDMRLTAKITMMWYDNVEWTSLTELPKGLTNRGDTVHASLSNRVYADALDGYSFITITDVRIGDYACYYDGWCLDDPTRIDGIFALTAATPIPGGTSTLPAGVVALKRGTIQLEIYTPNDEGAAEEAQWLGIKCIAKEMRQATHAAHMLIFLRPNSNSLAVEK